MKATTSRLETWWFLLWGILTVGFGAAAGLLTSRISNPFLIVLVFAGILAVVGTFARVELGLVVMSMMIYLRLSDVGVHFYGAPSILQPYLGLLVVIVFLRWVLVKEQPQPWRRAGLLLVLYGLVLASSLLYATDFDAALLALQDYSKDAVVAILTVVLLRRASALRQIIWGLLVVGIFMGSISVYQYFTGTFEKTYWGFGISNIQNIYGDTDSYRIAGPIGDPNYYGLILLVLVPLAFERIINEKYVSLKLVAGLALVVCMLSILFTYSRGAFVGLIIVAVVMLLRTPGKPAYFLLLAIAVFGIANLFLPPQYSERAKSILTVLPGSQDQSEADASITERYSELVISMEMFMEHSIIGVGKANYPAHYVEYALKTGISPTRTVYSPHNLYMEVLAENGLIGGLVFAVIIFQMMNSLIRAYGRLKNAGLLEQAWIVRSIGYGVIAYLGGSLFLHAAFSRYFWLLFGLAMAVQNIARNEIEALEEERIELDAAIR